MAGGKIVETIRKTRVEMTDDDVILMWQRMTYREKAAMIDAVAYTLTTSDDYQIRVSNAAGEVMIAADVNDHVIYKTLTAIAEAVRQIDG